MCDFAFYLPKEIVCVRSIYLFSYLSFFLSFFLYLITIIAAHVLTVHTTYILCHTVYTLFIYIYKTTIHMHILCTLLLCTSG